MHHDGYVDQLVAHGFAEAEAVSRAALVTMAEGRLRQFFPAGSEWRWWVPGRIEIFGKHTDYAGGRSLLAAVPRGFAVVARAREGREVRVIDARRGIETTVDSADHESPYFGWTNYVAAVVRRFSKNFPGATLGADIALASDLPSAAGLSSSSALIVGVALALIRRAGLESRHEWQAAIRNPLDLAWYLGCVENGSTYRELAGAEGVGTHGGSEDHTAILTCRAGFVSQYGFLPVRHLGDTAMPDEWSFVIASSGIHAGKAGRVRDQYNRASRSAGALVDVWNSMADEPASSLAAALASAPDAAGRLEALVKNATVPGWPTADLIARLAHFIGEDGRVPQAAAAFAARDTGALGELSLASQADAGTLLGNQIPETVALADAARTCGAFASSNFGAGFGGSVWALVLADDAQRFGRAWVEAYRSQQPHVERVEWFIARPSPADLELRG